MPDKPAFGSTIISGIAEVRTAFPANEPIPVPISVDTTFSPARLIIELPDRALRDLGTIDAYLNALAGDALQTVVAAGATTQVVSDRYGRLKTVSPKLTQATSNGTAITTATNTTVVSAPAATTHLRIHRLHACNSGSTSTFVYWCDGTGGTKYYPAYLPQNGIVSLNLRGSWDLTTATLLSITTSAAGNVEWHVSYETVAD